MKMLVGVDGSLTCEPAVRLLRRLNFAKQEWHFAHVVSPIDPSPENRPRHGAEASKALHDYLGDSDEATEMIDRFTHELQGEVHLDQGSAALGLMRIADKVQADLVGLGSSGRGAMSAAILGSVTRAFAIGSQHSFLVGRGDVCMDGMLNVLFCTDHSEYARKSLTTFLEMKPSGVEKIVVMTAYEMLELSEMAVHLNLLDEAKEQQQSLRQHLADLGNQSVAQCRSHGFNAIAELRGGFVSSAITEAVKQHSVDLVVLGAQGHGFFERLLIGSVALHEIASGKHSTLIVRVPTM